jgi:hypothetical protein
MTGRMCCRDRGFLQCGNSPTWVLEKKMAVTLRLLPFHSCRITKDFEINIVIVLLFNIEM